MSSEKFDPRKNLKPFPKGKSGNPGGVPKKDLVVRAFRETTFQQFIDNLQKYGSLSREEMARELQRPDATMFELMFGNIVASAAKGDDRARTLLIERLWGRVKEVVEQRVGPIDDEDYRQLTREEIILIAKSEPKKLEPTKE
jgi:hypothetical protein